MNNDAPTHNARFFMNYAIYLEQLVVMSFTGGFRDLAVVLKQTPKLSSLTILSVRQENMIDVRPWEDFISFSLHYLNVFNFQFQRSY